jgi:hypothetical protein
MYCLHLQEETKLATCFLLVSCLAIFNPKDGGGMSLQNVGGCLLDSQHYISLDSRLHSHCCENLKSNMTDTPFLKIMNYIQK